MALDKTFAAAYIDNGNQHKILGVKLRPFCPWHLFQFQFIDSPFLNAGQVYLYHLRRAVGICRLKFPNSRTRLPFFPLVVNQEKLSVEVKKLLKYIGDYLHKPEYCIKPLDEFSTRSSPKVSPAPEVVQLVFDAAHGANIPVTEAWNMPIGQAYIAQAMHYRLQGMMVDFLTDEEREFQAALKEHLSKNGVT